MCTITSSLEIFVIVLNCDIIFLARLFVILYNS